MFRRGSGRIARSRGDAAIRTTLVAALALASIASVHAAADGPGALPGRLPAGVRPVHYAIRVEPDAGALTFQGRASIDVRVERSTDTLVLNAADLQIASARADGTPASEVALDAGQQTATLRFAHPLGEGPHRLTFEYSGRIFLTSTGLFAVDYPAQGGHRRMLTTQFEVGDARRFAPMWDEPAAKATFDLEAVIPAGESAYSNMPVASIARENGKQRVRFACSPQMSSYLLHLTVGDLERVSRRVAGVDVGIVTRRGATESGRFALDAAAQILPWYNDYFGIPYPLPKLDMIAVPGSSQFFGAMENWGAIMYFEDALLIDPRLSSQSDRLGVFNAVAHEMAHQWFGNLVTMEWWDDLWLNEGYATWMAGKVTDALHPRWNAPLLAAGGSHEFAMQTDAGAATHPIVQPVPSVDAANLVFDAIAYNKGSAVIRMIEAGLGEAGFRDGIRRYLRRYSYGNTVTDQLWAELTAATSQPVAGIAHDFTLQPGVPLVSAATAPCASGHSRVTLTQSRFETGAPAAQRQTWRIPVSLLAVDSGERQTAAMDKDGGPVTVDVAGCGPVLVNAGQTGYYRVQYAESSLAQLRDHFARLADVDRLGLLNDTSALANAGRIVATSYVDLASAVPVASHPLVLRQVSRQFAKIDEWMSGSAQREAWREFARGRLRPMLETVGWKPANGESEPVALLRESLLETLGRLDDPVVVDGARDRFRRAERDPTAMPAATYDAVLTVAATHADEATWNEIRRRARAARQPMEKRRLYMALGRAYDPALSARALDLALTDEPPAAYVSNVMQSASLDHPEQAYDFAIRHEPEVLQRVDAASRWAFIPSLAEHSFDRATATRVRAYAEASIPADARIGAEKAIASIHERAAIRERQLPALEAWLQSRRPDAQ